MRQVRSLWLPVAAILIAVTLAVAVAPPAAQAGPIRNSIQWLIHRHDPQPTPTPTPTPMPVPVPVPVPTPSTIPAGRLWMIGVLSDLTQQTPAQGQIPASAELKRLLKARGDNFRWVDPQTAPPALGVWIQQATKDGLPRILILDAAPGGTVVEESVAVVDAAAALSLLKKWQGQ